MNRRTFLGLGAAAGALAGQQPKKREESVLATATQDRTPRVAIVLSSFRGSADHDGAPIAGLASPRPADAGLSPAQFDAMVRRALELGNTRTGGLHTIVGRQDWVVIKTCIGNCPDSNRDWTPGELTDPRMVQSVIHWLAGRGRGLRFSIVGRPASGNCWESEWGGAFGGLSYRKMIESLAKRYPRLRFEIVDLSADEKLELPVPCPIPPPEKDLRLNRIPKTIHACDRLISVAPLKTHARLGVSLTFGNYLDVAPLDEDPARMLDLFAYHPADYSVLGGCHGAEGDGGNGSAVRHNLVLAGTNAVATDTTAASVMGFDPSKLAYLKEAERRGFGICDPDLIWTRGNEIEQARRAFRKPSRWS